jgi:hypothetical protein
VIPESIPHRQKLNDYTNQAAQLLHEMEVLKEDLKNVKSLVKEELGKDVAKTFPSLVKARFQANKLHEVIEKAELALAENDILRGE